MDAWIYGGIRTPFGRHAGALAGLRPDDMAALTIREALALGSFDPAAVEDVILGCTNQAGEDSRNVARHAALLAGLPVEVAGHTVNRLCASGLQAVVAAAQAVHCGQGDLFVAGGVESMSRAPFVMAKAEAPYSRDLRVFDSTIGARFPNPWISGEYGEDTMPQTGDNVAAEHGISRQAADEFAARSQSRYAAALADGFFNDEIMPVEVPAGRKQPPVEVGEDEHPRPGTTVDKLAGLKPLFEGGVVTAGNASGVNDGATALVVGSSAAGAQPLARVVATACAGVAPRVMGLGPVPASQKALARAGLTLGDMDVIEINEAFASQVLGCLKLMKLAPDDERVNPNGGAIAVGHPLGASGARLVLTATHQLQRTGGRYALVSLCIGVGQGLAVILERA